MSPWWDSGGRQAAGYSDGHHRAGPTGQSYLKLDQLLAIVQDAEGVEVVRAGVWDHFTAHQVEGLLGCLAPVPVLVEVQVIAPDGAPA